MWKDKISLTRIVQSREPSSLSMILNPFCREEHLSVYRTALSTRWPPLPDGVSARHQEGLLPAVLNSSTIGLFPVLNTMKHQEEGFRGSQALRYLASWLKGIYFAYLNHHQ